VARFHLDHNVSRWLAPRLRTAGHDAVTARDAGLEQAGDDEQLLTAAQQVRILLTHNRRHYALLHDAWRRWPAAWAVAAPPHAGILVLDPADEDVLAAALLRAFLATAPPAPLANALYWWRSPGGWHRPLPDRGWEPYPTTT
jgi:hypothetical protein